jgi:hypothetical protein
MLIIKLKMWLDGNISQTQAIIWDKGFFGVKRFGHVDRACADTQNYGGGIANGINQTHIVY